MSFFMNFKIYPDRMDMIYIDKPNSQNSKIFAQNQNKTELLKFRKKVRIFKKKLYFKRGRSGPECLFFQYLFGNF